MNSLLETLDRITNTSHSRWLDRKKLGAIPAILKIRSIAEVDGLGACVIACMLLNPSIRTGVVQVSQRHEFRATQKYCLIALATAYGLDMDSRHTKRGLTITFGDSGKKRQLLITGDPSPGVLGGSDAIVVQFPALEQFKAVRGGAFIISHNIDLLNLDETALCPCDVSDSTYRLWKKTKHVRRKIRWGASQTKKIGPRTGRESDAGMRS
jgi:hypothetical protein